MHDDQLVIISDRDKGLLRAVKEQVPTAAHSYCCKHLSANLHKAVKDVKAVNLFWSCAKALTEEKFLQAMTKMEEQNPDARIWLDAIPHSDWTLYTFPRPWFGHITSNLAESMNSMLE